MSKVKRVRNCNALIELMSMAKSKRSHRFYKEQLYRQAMRLVEMKKAITG